ncbi:hypothetical protein IAD21_01477 [Abditibacteriota bacterium]|nr:hypothetical protein IAD21_01477 [Abditibacteriota bacterium]
MAVPLAKAGADTKTLIPKTPLPRTHIVWDKNSLRLVGPGGNYARMIRLRNGDILCGYGDGQGQWAKRSRDNGVTWDKGTLVVPKQPYGNFANAELLQLHNGNLLFFSNLRPFKNQPQSPPAAFAIGVSRSIDNGATWSPVEFVYRAGTDGANGCWEPAGLQLPSGEIQMFFADEGPYTQSDEQQISLMRSHDNGLHWSTPEIASFRGKHRDGMPIPVRLPNGDLAFAIEDSGLSGTFKPVIIGTTAQDNWKSGAVSGESSQRWSALRTPLDAGVYAGAPYLRVLSNGETVLSFQQADDGNMDHSQMVVCVGNSQARDFTDATRPFENFKTSAQLWNALFVKDKRTITAMTSTKIGDIFGVWTMEGHLVRN